MKSGTVGALTTRPTAWLGRKDSFRERLPLETLISRVRCLQFRNERSHIFLSDEGDRASAPSRTCEPAAKRPGLARDRGELVELRTRALKEIGAAVHGQIHQIAELPEDILARGGHLVGAEADVAEFKDAKCFSQDMFRALVKLEMRRFH